MGNGESGGGDRNHSEYRTGKGKSSCMSEINRNQERVRAEASKTSQGNQGKGSGIDQNKSSKVTSEINQGKAPGIDQNKSSKVSEINHGGPGIYQNESNAYHNETVDKVVGAIANNILSDVVFSPIASRGIRLVVGSGLTAVGEYTSANQKVGHAITERMHELGGGSGQTVRHEDGSKTVIYHGLSGGSHSIKVSKDGKEYDFCP